MAEKNEGLSLSEVAKRLGVSATAVRKAIVTGRLNANIVSEVKVVSHYSVSEDDLKKYLESTYTYKDGRRKAIKEN